MELTNRQIITINDVFEKEWATAMNEIKISPLSAYKLVAIKHEISTKATEIREAAALVVQKHGVVTQDQQLSEEQVNNINEELNELENATTQLTAAKVVLQANDVIPIGLLDKIFDIVEMGD